MGSEISGIAQLQSENTRFEWKMSLKKHQEDTKIRTKNNLNSKDIGFYNFSHANIWVPKFRESSNSKAEIHASKGK